MTQPATGMLAVLNVGDGDTKLSFDKDNPAERIRAARIVTDMLRRSYALMVEVEVDGEKKYQRVHEFNEETCEYIIADFDPTVEQPPIEPRPDGEKIEVTPAKAAPRGRSRKVALPAESTKAVSIARSAGG